MVEHRTKDREAYNGSIPWVRREEREVGRSFGGKDGWELVFEWEEDAATRARGCRCQWPAAHNITSAHHLAAVCGRRTAPNLERVEQKPHSLLRW